MALSISPSISIIANAGQDVVAHVREHVSKDAIRRVGQPVMEDVLVAQ